MATLVGNAKYGDGHKIIIKDKLSAVAIKIFRDSGYVAGKSVFTLSNSVQKPQGVINLGTGNSEIKVKDDKGKTITIKGSASSINGSFNHYSANAKSNTGLLTEVKEYISMYIFQAYVEKRKILTEDEARAALPSTHRANYDTTYYESSIKQLEELKKYVKSNGYTYERQGADRTKQMYAQARKLSGLANDNWNPADVWMIKKSYKGLDNTFTNIEELNGVIEDGWNSRDIIPISLKHVSTNRAASEIVSPTALRQTSIDVSFDKVDLSNTYANFILQTKSGFACRVGFKASASTLNVSVEGRMVGAGYQIGGVDAKQYVSYCKEKYGYTLRSGTNVTKGDMEKAKTELKEIMYKHPRISNTVKTYDEAIKLFNGSNELTQQRFANLISYLYSFMILPRSNFDEHMKFCYFTAKKMSTKSSIYILLK